MQRLRWRLKFWILVSLWKFLNQSDTMKLSQESGYHTGSHADQFDVTSKLVKSNTLANMRMQILEYHVKQEVEGERNSVRAFSMPPSATPCKVYPELNRKFQ